MFLFIFVTTMAIIASVLLHLGATQVLISLWQRNNRLLRWRVAVLIVAYIFVHLVEIAFFTLAIDTLLQDGSFGHLEGVQVESARSLFYFSAITYTTVGYGDITPLGDLRVFAAIEALTGMVLVAWTASAIFTVMNRMWRAERAKKTPA